MNKILMQESSNTGAQSPLVLLAATCSKIGVEVMGPAEQSPTPEKEAQQTQHFSEFKKHFINK